MAAGGGFGARQLHPTEGTPGHSTWRALCAGAQGKRLVTPARKNGRSQQRAIKNWRDKSRHARREEAETAGPVDTLISERFLVETAAF